MKHVTGGQQRLSLLISLPIGAENITITADDFLGLRIPNDKLFAPSFHHVELIYIHRLTRSAARRAKSYFSQSANLLHNIGRALSRNDIYLVITLVCHSQLLIERQLTFQRFPANGLDKDRKSTRLNSSHANISYAVFCLKK